MGCHDVIITGAVGSLRAEVGPVSCDVTDHINFQPGNPLVGPNDESIGPRFFGMEDAYDLGLQDMMKNAADELKYSFA